MTWMLIAALMAVGMVLLVAEVAIIPGFGVAGVSSALLLAGGVFLAWSRYGITWGVCSLLIAGLLAAGIIVIAPRTRAGRSLVLKAAITEQHPADGLEALVGQTGVALSTLRPTGAAEIAGRRVDVVTDGDFVVAGSRIRVVSVEGNRVVVATIAPET